MRRWVRYTLYATLGAVVGWAGYQGIRTAATRRRRTAPVEE